MFESSFDLPAQGLGSVVGGLTSLLLAVALTPLVRTVAIRFGYVAQPRHDRWHQRKTACFGGVGFFLAFVAAYHLFRPPVPGVGPIIACATLLFAAGLLDDVFGFKPVVKLVLQVVAAATVVYVGIRPEWTPYPVLNEVIGIFWLVGISNAINLLDNMDGLAGGISVISCVFLAISFLMNGQGSEAMVVVMMGAAVLGFLVFNFQPASIFMGDCGSMFLGFMIGGIALLMDYGRSRNLVAVLATPVLILMIPIFDTCLVSITRKLSGRPASQGGKDHSSHRLVALGMTERRAVLTLYGLAALSGSLALIARLLGVEVLLVIIVGFALSVVFLGVYLGMVRIYEDTEPLPAHTTISALSEFSYKRRVFEILLDVVLIVVTYYAAYLLRFDGTMGHLQVQAFVTTVPLVIVIEIAFLLLGGVYSGLWRYLSVDGAIQIAKGVFPGGAAAGLVTFAIHGLQGPPRTVFVLQTLLLLLAIGGTRLSFRVIRALILASRKPVEDGNPIIIYGAGDAGEILLREIVNNPTYRYVPVGFIDDDTRKAGRFLHGFRIFPRQQLPDLMQRHGINEVLISSSKVPESVLDDLRGMGVVLRRLSIRIE